MERGEVVQVEGDLMVLRTVDTSEDRQRPPEQPLGLRAFSLAVQDRGQRGHVCRDLGVVGAERPFAKRHGAARQRLSAGEPAAGVLQAAQIVVNARDVRMMRAERAGVAASAKARRNNDSARS
jgi:hypothetical protein